MDSARDKLHEVVRPLLDIILDLGRVGNLVSHPRVDEVDTHQECEELYSTNFVAETTRLICVTLRFLTFFYLRRERESKKREREE